MTVGKLYGVLAIILAVVVGLLVAIGDGRPRCIGHPDNFLGELCITVTPR